MLDISWLHKKPLRNSKNHQPTNQHPPNLKIKISRRLVFNVCLFAAPLSSLRTVFRNKSSELLPVLPSLLGLTLGVWHWKKVPWNKHVGIEDVSEKCWMGILATGLFLCWKSEIFLTWLCFATYERSKNGWDLALNQRNTLQGTDTYPTKREVRKIFAPWGSPWSTSGKKSGLNLLICSIPNYRYPYLPPRISTWIPHLKGDILFGVSSIHV